MSDLSVLDYVVRVAPGALGDIGAMAERTAPAHSYAIVTDERVGHHHLAAVRDSFARVSAGHRLIEVQVPPGEQFKTRVQWAGITDALLDRGAGRDTTIIALGGGVVGDLAGFVAATFMRGVPYLQVPTTLLAMVDASVGGKTAVDTPAGKNLVGAFHQPAAVVIDPLVLRTLDDRHFRAGLAEVLKHGIIADAAYFAEVVALLPVLLTPAGRADPALARIIARSVEIKAAVVERDPREEGLRKTLNFGHTVGQAVESASGYALLHGEAIAIGMRVESDLAERAGVSPQGLATGVQQALRAAGLPTNIPDDLDAADVLARMHADKKTRRDRVEFALPRRLGLMAGEADGWALAVDPSHVREALLRAGARDSSGTPVNTRGGSVP